MSTADEHGTTGQQGTEQEGAGQQGETSTAVFAAGCFWGVEDAYRRVRGVSDVEVGYTGGSTVGPSYEEVCGGGTGHAEAVRVVFDPGVVTYPELLDVLWKIHNPTTLNRQGNDVGTQYRSAVYVLDEAQRADAEAAVEGLRASGLDVVTEVAPAAAFYRAEEEHQRYLEKHPFGYCHIPKKVLRGIGERAS